MKSINLKSRLWGAILSLSLLLGIGLASGITTQAQFRNDQDGRYGRDRDQDQDRDRDDRDNDRNRRGRNWGRYGNYGGSYQLRQTALNAGYNEGIKEGRKDSRRNESYDFRDEGAYKSATKDYSSRLGDKDLYRRYFRDGFENGYADGYRGY